MPFTVQQHFERAGPGVRATYDRLLGAARKLGPVVEVRLTSPADVDRELAGWIETSYALSE